MPKIQYPQTPFLDTSGRPDRVWHQFLTNLTNFDTVKEAFPGDQTLPERPAGFLTINVSGQDVLVPYYLNKKAGA